MSELFYTGDVIRAEWARTATYIEQIETAYNSASASKIPFALRSGWRSLVDEFSTAYARIEDYFLIIPGNDLYDQAVDFATRAKQYADRASEYLSEAKNK
jgi:hypothetical protein